MTESGERKRKRDKKPNPLFVDWLMYLLLRLVVPIFYLIGVNTCLRFACFMGRVLWRRYERGRIRALDNLRASFPDKDQAWLEEIGRRSFEHIAMLPVDIIFTPRLVERHNRAEYSRYINVERTKWLVQEGRGMLMVAAHYSNFEVLGYIFAVAGFDIYSIARPLDNKFINRYLYSVREKQGQKIIDKKGAAEMMEAIASQRSVLGFIADQDAGKKGVFVDFFGRKASSYKSIGLLAMQYKIPIAVVFSRRVGNRFFFEVGVKRVIMPEEWADKDYPLEWITAEYTKATEEFVREDPSQYWWLHRRWKTLPKKERESKSKIKI